MLHLMPPLTAWWCHRPYDCRAASYSSLGSHGSRTGEIFGNLESHASAPASTTHSQSVLRFTLQSASCCRDKRTIPTAADCSYTQNRIWIAFAFSEGLTNYYTREMIFFFFLPPFVILRHIIGESSSNCIKISFRIHERAIKVMDEEPDRWHHCNILWKHNFYLFFYFF